MHPPHCVFFNVQWAVGRYLVAFQKRNTTAQWESPQTTDFSPMHYSPPPIFSIAHVLSTLSSFYLFTLHSIPYRSLLLYHRPCWPTSSTQQFPTSYLCPRDSLSVSTPTCLVASISRPWMCTEPFLTASAPKAFQRSMYVAQLHCVKYSHEK